MLYFQNDTIIDSDMVSDFSDTEIDIEFKSAKDDVDFDTSRMDSQMLGSEYKASSVKTTSAVHVSRGFELFVCLSVISIITAMFPD